MPVRLNLNFKHSESDRLSIALLFSFVLHAFFLFIFKFAQPSWEKPFYPTTPLSVVLNNLTHETSDNAGVAEAAVESTGKARVGVQEKNAFTPKKLSVINAKPVEMPEISSSKILIDKKILTIDKPSEITVPKRETVILVAEAPPSKLDKEEAPPPPAPSIENSVAKTLPVIEKLVSAESTPGKKQEKIIIAESFAKKSAIETSGNDVVIPDPIKPEPVKVAKPEPLPIPEPVKPIAPPEQPAHTKVEEPKLVKIQAAEPVKLEVPEIKPPEIKPPEIKQPEIMPPKIEVPKITIAEPALARNITPIKTEAPVLHKITPQANTDKPVQPEAEKPSNGKAMANTPAPASSGVKSDIFRKDWPGIERPGGLNFGIVSDRKFSGEKDKKIQFGERRKIVDIKEREIRYAMYIEGVRLKLERVGYFNYPAEAARNNLSGTLSARISIRADGSLEDFYISRPSNHASLNEGAERIVRMSAPFSPLSDDIKKDTDILSITINWTFANSRQSFD